jgi:malate dehydrogenase (oxaloacetate-decarboxylating)
METMRVVDRPSGHDAAAGGIEPPQAPLLVAKRGAELLGDPLLNKDTAFDEREREAFGLLGLLPAHVLSIAEQTRLELEHVRRKSDALEQYIGLAALHDRNETLFYRLLVENLEEFLPIVYTPTVGRACQEFSHILRKPRGLWITPADVGRIPDLLRAAGRPEVRLIVVTDNERILGLGDQGAGGMGIPVGKLAIYTAAAGIYPAYTLPISLDVGTDREDLLADPLYAGYRSPRLRGEAYDRMVDAFVGGVRSTYPDAVLQWEDFKQHNAIRLLERYRHRFATFNDDIQGTGAVVLAGLLAALRLTGEPLSRQRILFVGAGAASIGIGRLVQMAAVRGEGAVGNRAGEGGPDIAMVDTDGLVHADRPGLDAEKREFAMRRDALQRLGLDEGQQRDLAAIVDAFAPTILIGATASAGTFSEPVVRAMAGHVRTPIILPLSNPTERSEARPADLIAWTDGRAVVATGSPFDPVPFEGRLRLIAQANNAFVFPGVGLGAIVASANEVTDRMFLAAGDALSSMVSPERLALGALYPPISELREVSRAIAIAVAREGRDGGIGRALDDQEIEREVTSAMWFPTYLPYVAG